MPFLGQDWRSPGEQWVRTTEGWERLKLWRLKLLESLNENVISRLLKLANYEDLIKHKEMEGRGSQPYVLVVKPGRASKELTVHTGIGEAMSRLDLSGAIKDLRRFNFVCKTLEYLIQHKLSNMSGAGQKTIFNLLEEVLSQVIKTHNNVRTVQQLLDNTKKALKDGHYDHLGSAQLWEKHAQAVNRMQCTLTAMQLKQREEDGKVTISDLPDEVIREILLCLHDHKDLARTGLTERRAFEMSQERRVWRNLCVFHFSNKQWNVVVRRGETLEGLGWKKLFLRLVKRYGERDVFAEMLHLCRHCNALFWEHHGHPCIFSNIPAKSVPISPTMCVELFTA